MFSALSIRISSTCVQTTFLRAVSRTPIYLARHDHLLDDEGPDGEESKYKSELREQRRTVRHMKKKMHQVAPEDDVPDPDDWWNGDASPEFLQGTYLHIPQKYSGLFDAKRVDRKTGFVEALPPPKAAPPLRPRDGVPLSTKQLRVANIIHRVLHEELVRQRYVRDPRLANVTFLSVRVNRDLTIATVFWEESGSDKKMIENALKNATGLFRTCVANEMLIKFVPELVFKHDSPEDRYTKFEQLTVKAGFPLPDRGDA